MARAVGIDLGTTYSAVAVTDRLGTPEILRNREGENITPSVVLFQGGSVVVGTQAKRSAATAPEHVVQFVKRRIGEPGVVYSADDGTDYRAEEISALILKRLKEDAELVLGEEVDRAVITVPAYFDDARRVATRDAGRIAGLEVLRVINEPTAAALAYGLDAEPGESPGTILVFDLGGGTFDVTVMRIEDGEFEVLATDGDRNLGGYDWDNALMSHLNTQFMEAGGPDLLEDDRATAELRDKAEIAKRTLSLAPQAVVALSADGHHEQLRITRETFEQITKHLLDQCEILAESVVRVGAGLDWSGIDKVLLVGGSTRMPMVVDLVARLSGKESERGVEQDEVVALGAALVALDEEVRGKEAERKATAQAAQAAPGADDTPTLTGTQDVSSNADASDTLDLPQTPVPLTKAAPGSGLARLTGGKVTGFKDVTSQALGVVATDEEDHTREYNVVVIPKNTTLPAKKSETLNTLYDNQTRLRVQVTEGEDDDLEYVAILGESTLEIPPHPKGAPLDITYSYDLDGIVHVEVRDVTEDRFLGEFEIERTANLADEEIGDAIGRVSRTEAL
ncbi:molecular chaperone DnaK [Mangrovactinospora gilvigrisea]|uniref:Molecular chaperone DnaK n=1 Tax=Mangrovactinospora gilvigrisea TaxID=1428644 RepID=A0A1J7BDB0_9ACTN|nr:Hsp70 family protein [Mangrovactinospora gilvigrisea]OIV36565.1 molecular chaperone DnaK [Mangrovactinospora gilvigrisea]